MLSMTSIKFNESHITLTWHDDITSSFPHFWLRDHAQDDVSWDHRSHQREFFTASSDLSMLPEKPHINDDGSSLILKWPDQSQPISYPSEFLYNFAITDQRITTPYRCWNKFSIDEKALYLEWNKISKDNNLTDEGISELIKTIHDLGFAVLNNAPTNLDSVNTIATGLGYVRETIFGGLWQFAANEGMDDSAYTPKELRPHTDGTYSHDAPGLQMLLCCHYNAEGGDSIIVDGFTIHDWMREHHPVEAQTLAEISIPGQYIGDGTMLKAERPPFQYGLDGRIRQVSFNNYDRAPFRLSDEKMSALYKAIQIFDRKVNDHNMQWRQILEPGQMIVLITGAFFMVALRLRVSVKWQVVISTVRIMKVTFVS